MAGEISPLQGDPLLKSLTGLHAAGGSTGLEASRWPGSYFWHSPSSSVFPHMASCPQQAGLGLPLGDPAFPEHKSRSCKAQTLNSQDTAFATFYYPKQAPGPAQFRRAGKQTLSPDGWSTGQGSWPQGVGVAGALVTVICLSSSLPKLFSNVLPHGPQKGDANSHCHPQCLLGILILKQTGAVSSEGAHTTCESRAAFCPKWPQSSPRVATRGRAVWPAFTRGSGVWTEWDQLDVSPSLCAWPPPHAVVPGQAPHLSPAHNKRCFFKNMYLFIYFEREGKGGEKERERNFNQLPCTPPNRGPGLKPRHVP